MNKGLRGLMIASGVLITSGALVSGIAYGMGASTYVSIDNGYPSEKTDVMMETAQVVEDTETALSGDALSAGEYALSIQDYPYVQTVEPYQNMEIKQGFYNLVINRVPDDFWEVSYRKEGYTDWKDPKISVKNGTLYVEASSKKPSINSGLWNWGEGFNWEDESDWDRPSICLTIPESASFNTVHLEGSAASAELTGLPMKSLKADISMGEIIFGTNVGLNDVKITTDAGRCEASNLTGLQSLNIKNQMGDLELRDVTAQTVRLEMQAGSCVADNLTGIQNLSVQNQMGTVELRGLQAGTVDLQTQAGGITLENCNIANGKFDSNMAEIEASGLVSGGLEIQAQAGDIDLEGSFSGITKIDTQMGNVELQTSLPKSAYNLDCSTQMGSIDADGEAGRQIKREGNAANSLRITTQAGSVELSFGD